MFLQEYSVEAMKAIRPAVTIYAEPLVTASGWNLVGAQECGYEMALRIAEPRVRSENIRCPTGDFAAVEVNAVLDLVANPFEDSPSNSQLVVCLLRQIFSKSEQPVVSPINHVGCLQKLFHISRFFVSARVTSCIRAVLVGQRHFMMSQQLELMISSSFNPLPKARPMP